MMNWGTWDHVIKNSSGKVIFHGPLDACISIFMAGRGKKFNWVICRDEVTRV